MKYEQCEDATWKQLMKRDEKWVTALEYGQVLYALNYRQLLLRASQNPLVPRVTLVRTVQGPAFKKMFMNHICWIGFPDAGQHIIGRKFERRRWWKNLSLSATMISTSRQCDRDREIMPRNVWWYKRYTFDSWRCQILLNLNRAAFSKINGSKEKQKFVN